MKSSHIIAILGIPKSGKTSLALNLAAGFSKEGETTLFVETATGLGFVFGKKGDIRKTTMNVTPYTLDALKKEYSIIVADLGSTFDESTQKMLEHVSAIFAPAESTPESLSQTRILLNHIYRVYPHDLVYVILSRYTLEEQTRKEMNLSAMKLELGCNILGAVAQDPVISTSSPTSPFVFTHPQALASRYIFQLIKIIQTKKILEKGELLQKRRMRIVSIPPSKTPETLFREPSEPPSPSFVEAKRPPLFDRFAKEESPRDPRTHLKLNIMKQLSTELNLKKLDTETGNDPKKIAVLRQKTRQAIMAIIEREKIFIGDKTETERFIKEILDEALGLGPLEELLADPTITEIMVNRKDQIFVEKNGKVVLSPLTFTGDAQLLGIIERIVAPLGRRIDEKTPYVDARLPDGSRVHAIIPPLAIQGPTLTIRKFPERNFTVADLIRFGTLTEDIADFLRAAIESRLNCIVSGGTGCGKTTLLNVLSSFIPQHERIITVEDSAELRLTQPHVLRLESRPANIEGSGAISIRDLVKNTLRMRPDRIVVGECRDGAALDMLQAMNTGHDGSLTTIHANSARDCLARLETLVMMAGMELPSRAIREQIASAINLIIHGARFSDGSRKIITVSEITGMEGNVITTAEIIRFKQTGIDLHGKVIGQFEYTHYVPKFIHELEKKGLRVPKGFLTKKSVGEGR